MILGKLLDSALSWLRGARVAISIAIVVGLVAALLLTRATLAGVKGKLAAEQAAHQLTVAGYRKAAAEAAAQDRANALRVEREQKEITDAVSTDYQAKLAALRVRYDSMLAKAPANPRGGGIARVPETSPAAGRPDAAAADHGFSLDARLIASEQALQLQALQEWVRQQAAVD